MQSTFRFPCATKSRKLCNNLECETCPQKSFSSNPKSIYWSVKNVLTPSQVFKATDKKYWFDCDKKECGHIFESSPNQITTNNQWCPYCANIKLCDDDACQSCLKKSFLSNPLCIYWSPKNQDDPRNLFKNAHNLYIFDCTTCNHDFPIRLYNVTCGSNWCPYCANKKLCDQNDCKTCFDKSFASCKRSLSWVLSKNKLESRQVFKYCHTKFYFKCICGYEFQMSPDMINGKETWCRNCRNGRSEKCAREILESLTVYKWPTIRPDWLLNPETGFNLEMDGFCKELKMGFEYQGRQHVIFIPHWHKTIQMFYQQQARDQLKYELSIKAGKPYIQIPHTYTYKNVDAMRLFIQAELKRLGVPMIINTDQMNSVKVSTLLTNIEVLINKRKHDEITLSEDNTPIELTKRTRVLIE